MCFDIQAWSKLEYGMLGADHFAVSVRLLKVIRTAFGVIVVRIEVDAFYGGVI